MSGATPEPTTLYWHDYETTGPDPRRHRPSQFAGIRTDEDLNILGEPLAMYCKPGHDILPDPEACLLTGITPQKAEREGLPELQFVAALLHELTRPGTCGVGYNSIRFDDEVTRHTLYRNLYDPYSREWQNGNSRWDIIDMVRLTYALRPDGIEWPTYEDGRPSFKLEQLTTANGIAHDAAHNALSDVYATIGLARLIKTRQPKLYDYLYQHRRKREAMSLLDIRNLKPVLHASAMYPNEYGCVALVAPLARHPVNSNGVVVYDLRYDPADLINLPAQQVRERIFTARDDLPDGVERVPLKVVHLNKAPVIVPLSTLDEASSKRTQIDLSKGLKHLQMLRQARDLAAKIQTIYSEPSRECFDDPELNLYSGFLNDQDKAEIARVRAVAPEALGQTGWFFHDPRLAELLFRYRARNFPETLSAEEQARWRMQRQLRLCGEHGEGFLGFAEYYATLARLRETATLSENQQALLQELVVYGDRLSEELGWQAGGQRADAL